MKFNLKTTNNQGLSLKDVILESRGVSNSSELLSPPSTAYECPSKYYNMQKAYELFMKHIEEGSDIGILVDCDLDGYLSGSIPFGYIGETFYGSNTHIFLHEGKVHGLDDIERKEEILESGISLLIIPDASSNEYKHHNELIEKGIDVIVLDHHEVEQKIADKSKAIIVNNQLSDVNKNLSGTGVTYKFFSYVDKMNDCDNASKYKDLVALSIVSDIMDLREVENRLFFEEGFSNPYNQVIKAFLKNNKKTITPTELAFNLCPPINAIIRIGTYEEKLELFLAICNVDKTVVYKPRGKEPINQHLSEAILRIGTSVKGRQDRAVKKMVEIVEAKIQHNKLDENKILIVEITDIVDGEVGGLVCSKLVSKYNRPTMLLRWNSKRTMLSGSARGLNNCAEVPNFKEFILKTGLADYAEGHGNAFGCSFSPENLIRANEIFNKILSDANFTTAYDVDAVMDAKELNINDLKDMAELEKLWCSHIKEPVFYVSNIPVNSSDIRKIGNSTYVWKAGNVNFTKNFGSKVWFEDLVCLKENAFGCNRLNINMVCKFRKNAQGYSYIEVVDTESYINQEIMF